MSHTDAQTIRDLLLDQFVSTHSREEWHMPLTQALEGLDEQNAAWKDAQGNHSIKQLVYHLLFWNQEYLDKFTGRKKETYKGDNDDTFNFPVDQRWRICLPGF